MNRRPRFCAIMLLFLVCAVIALRHDLSQWQMFKADQEFHKGNLRAACIAWSSATIIPSARWLALHNRGVCRYRLGETTAAAADFRAAAESGDSDLRQQSLYNLGTTLLIMEQEQKSTDRRKGEQLLAEAVRRLGEAMTLRPTDTAAGHNKIVAQARLMALAGKIRSGRPGAAPEQQPSDKAKQSAVTPKQPEQAGAKQARPGAATELDSATGHRRVAPPVSAEQAMRMLDDLRGREALRSAVAAGNRLEKLTPPEKDW